MLSPTSLSPSHTGAGLSAASPNVPSELLKEKSLPAQFLLQRDSPTAHASQGSHGALSPAPSDHAWLNEVSQDLPPPQRWVHQDLALPESPVLRPALAEPLETSLCPSSEMCANQGTAGRGLKTQCLHIGGIFWKP